MCLGLHAHFMLQRCHTWKNLRLASSFMMCALLVLFMECEIFSRALRSCRPTCVTPGGSSSGDGKSSISLSAQGTLTCRSIQSRKSQHATLVQRTINSESRQNTLLLLPMLNKL